MLNLTNYIFHGFPPIGKIAQAEHIAVEITVSGKLVTVSLKGVVVPPPKTTKRQKVIGLSDKSRLNLLKKFGVHRLV